MKSVVSRAGVKSPRWDKAIRHQVSSKGAQRPRPAGRPPQVRDGQAPRGPNPSGAETSVPLPVNGSVPRGTEPEEKPEAGPKAEGRSRPLFAKAHRTEGPSRPRGNCQVPAQGPDVVVGSWPLDDRDLEFRDKPYRGEVEFFAVFSPDLGKVYLVPVDVAGRSNGNLRVVPSTYKKTARNWAKDYEFKGTIPLSFNGRTSDCCSEDFGSNPSGGVS